MLPRGTDDEHGETWITHTVTSFCFLHIQRSDTHGCWVAGEIDKGL